MAIAFGAIGTKSAGGTTSISVPYPASPSAGDLLLTTRCGWLDTVAFSTPSGWTAGSEGPSGTGSASGAHTTDVRSDYKEAAGGESGSLSCAQTGTISGVLGVMLRYTKSSTKIWSVLAVTGIATDTGHGANRGTAATSGSMDVIPGDVVVAIVGVDTDTSLTITSPLYTVAGGGGRSLTRRTSGAGVATGLLGNVEVFDRTSAETETGVVAFGMTTTTSQCGPTVFLRLREVNPPPGAGTATGTADWTGTAVGKRDPKATSSGTATWTGAAVGERTPKASSTGAYAYLGDATGKRDPKASTSGAFTWTGAAVGQAPDVAFSDGTATGAFTWTGASVGKRDPQAAGTGSYAYSGTADGTTQRTGDAAGTWAYLGTAEGSTQPQGTASGDWSYLGAAAGQKPGEPHNITITTTLGDRHWTGSTGQRRWTGGLG